VDSDRAAYVLGFEGSRPSQSAALAGSILRIGDVVMVVMGEERADGSPPRRAFRELGEWLNCNA
jgi:hypothetical protein